MDKIAKILEKLSKKEKEAIKEILLVLRNGNLGGFDVKKLKGREDIFRIRKGNIRIIFKFKNKEVFLLSIERRSDNTYKK